MRYALLSCVLLLAACSNEAVVERYDARLDDGSTTTCEAGSCEDGVTKSFSALDPMHQFFLILTVPVWSMGG